MKDIQALFLLSQAGTSGKESLSLLPQDFSEFPERPELAFAELSPAQTTYLTHGYHRYPAKFIPQLARKLIEQYSQPGDWVLDPMAGSYTACVEALLAGRRAVGVDINPVAHLIGRAKTTPLDPSQLDLFLTAILRRASEPTPPGQGWQIPEVSRLNSWHPPEIKAQLAQLLSAIQPLPEDYRDFFLCAFSHVLKSCSWWSMKSTKPIHLYEKMIPNPIATFRRHAELMIRRHREYREQLPPQIVQEFPQWCQLHCGDARKLPLADESVSLVVTSPPYVTSYEYADLHQLSALWLAFADSLVDFRNRFVGSGSRRYLENSFQSQLAEHTVVELASRKSNLAASVGAYFRDMGMIFQELRRVIKPGGRACIVIGDTALAGVPIMNAEVYAEQLIAIGFELEEVIKRRIPSKILPQGRDPVTGRFASSKDVEAYPHEYILVVRRA